MITTSRAWRTTLRSALVCLLLVSSITEATASEAVPAAPKVQASSSRFGVGLEIGYGYGTTPRDRQKGKDVGEVRFIAANPHIRVRLWEKEDPNAWYQGRLDGLLIGSVMLALEPNGGYAGGAVVDLRYTIMPGRTLQPYVEGGIGFGSLAFELESQSDGFSFILQAGGGVRWQVARHLALTTSILWHHISNAQLREPNSGIDAVLFQVGILSW